jgi:hypothetical protein
VGAAEQFRRSAPAAGVITVGESPAPPAHTKEFAEC